MNKKTVILPEWRMPVVAMTGNNSEGKMRSLVLVPELQTKTENDTNAHLLLCLGRIVPQANAFTHPYQFYEFQGEYKEVLTLSQAEPLHFTNWGNWSEILSFLGIDDLVKTERQTLFFYQFLINNLPLNVYIPLGRFSYHLLAKIQEKGIRKITPFELAAIVESSCF